MLNKTKKRQNTESYFYCIHVFMRRIGTNIRRLRFKIVIRSLKNASEDQSGDQGES